MEGKSRSYTIAYCNVYTLESGLFPGCIKSGRGLTSVESRDTLPFIIKDRHEYKHHYEIARVFTIKVYSH